MWLIWYCLAGIVAVLSLGVSVQGSSGCMPGVIFLLPGLGLALVLCAAGRICRWQEERREAEEEEWRRRVASQPPPPAPPEPVRAAAPAPGEARFATRAGVEYLVCPLCGKEQQADRKLCFRCGAAFRFDDEP